VLDCTLKNEVIVLFVIIFGRLSFPAVNPSLLRVGGSVCPSGFLLLLPKTVHRIESMESQTFSLAMSDIRIALCNILCMREPTIPAVPGDPGITKS